MEPTISRDTTKVPALAHDAANHNDLSFVHQNPTPITPTFLYPGLPPKTEVVDLTTEFETEHIDLTVDIASVPKPLKTPSKHTSGEGHVTKAGQGPTRLRINVTSPAISRTALKPSDNEVAKQEFIMQESSFPIIPGKDKGSNGGTQRRSRSVSPESRIYSGSRRTCYICVRSKAAHTGQKVNEAIVQVLEDLTIIRMKRIGDKHWIFARQGADWDDKDERLDLEFIKAMAWRIEEDGNDYIVMWKRFRSSYNIRDVRVLQTAIKYHRNMTPEATSVKLGLDVIRYEQLENYRHGSRTEYDADGG
ncbi:hypothetical protein FKW77_001090 [Venturia effusa]|uniref:Uncharacterized protein n=1 Tax=Venturia effusa TaxID=50376 RepID=A0A517LD68_9PEZI|nr:hypothetical protein FKW77_001090 [Venturia effusa]